MVLVLPISILLVFFLATVIFGMVLIRSVMALRLDLLIPLGMVLGLAMTIFFLNSAAFIAPGTLGLTFGLMCLPLVTLFTLSKSKLKPIELLSNRAGIYWLVPLMLWIGFLAQKAIRVTIGSDANLYYSIASTFVHGNFPITTPWQSSLPLAYHTGVFELLGTLQWLTGLNFQFIHVVLAGVFIFSGVQIVTAILTKHYTFFSTIYAHLAALAIFVSFGLWKIVIWIGLPKIGSIWNLPTAYQSLDIYGSTVTLDGMFYTLFYPVGLAILLLIAFLTVKLKNNWSLRKFILILVNLASLALVNEAIFIPTAVGVGIFLGFVLLRHRSAIILGLVFVAIILLQGGYIAATIFAPVHLEKAVFFPLFNSDPLSRYANSYHLSQITSRQITAASWPQAKIVHIGLATLALFTALFVVRRHQRPNLATLLFFISLAAVMFYFIIAPKYEMANANRIIIFAYQLTSLSLLLGIYALDRFKILLGIIFLPIAFFSIVPPLLTLSYRRSPENYPKLAIPASAAFWVSHSLAAKDRILVLDDRAPFTSGAFAQMIDSGISSPTFDSKQRVYSMEPGPDYIDSFYTLNPTSMSNLGVNYLMLSPKTYALLPQLRQRQLADETLFQKRYSDATATIYKITDAYLNSQDLSGSLRELNQIAPKEGKFFVVSQKYFDPDFLRRAVIFSLRDRELYFENESGVYLHVEALINAHQPGPEKYEYYVLTDKVTPQEICACKTNLIWKGLNNTLILWKRI